MYQNEVVKKHVKQSFKNIKHIDQKEVVKNM